MAKKSRRSQTRRPRRGAPLRRGGEAPSTKMTSRAGEGAGAASPAAAPNRNLIVVGIGASAGGLDALTNLLKAMPGDTGMAFVIIQHLDPTRSSLAAELLSRHTKMKVAQLETPQTQPAGNHVYVIPPNKYLSIVQGMLQLSEPAHPRGARMPIDYFLRSLAEDRQERAVAVILSGTGSDGTLGAKAVKVAGGLVLAQDPTTANHEGMPRSALEAGVVDYVRPPEALSDFLARWVRHPYMQADKAEQEPRERTSSDFDRILALLRARAGYDFRPYRQATLLRRTHRRMGMLHIEGLAPYLEYLRDHDAEVQALVQDMLISVTDFFREPEAWHALGEKVIGPLVAEKESDAPIRVWVPGCATGEEAYSITMLLLDELQRTGKHCPLQVFASDVDKKVLAYARQGLYPRSIAADVPGERLRRFFSEVKDDHHSYQVDKALRDVIVFAEHNVISDPPFSKLDLVCCRNLLIYLRPDVQQKIMNLFHFALAPGGHLFLGNAEVAGDRDGLFAPVSRKWRIYQRVLRTDAPPLVLSQTGHSRTAGQVTPSAVHRHGAQLPQLVEHALVGILAPAAVLVDRSWQIVYFSGDTDPYLTHTGGTPSLDLLHKARPGLRVPLRACIQKAQGAQRPVSALARVKVDERMSSVRITAHRLRQPDVDDVLVLIVFEPEPAESAKSGRSEQGQTGGRSRGQATATIDHDELVRRLEEELKSALEDLQTTVEQLSASNEEFKAAHEEATSINEELQSTNEELETGKEELQSLNEELNTVNNQLAAKIEELESKNNDLANLLTSTDIATICLDRTNRVRWFTPAASQLVRLVPSDVGRPFSDFAHALVDDRLLDETDRVLKDLTPAEREVVAKDGRYFLRRIQPYRTEDDRIDGVVITLVDISQRKHAEDQLRKLNDSLEDQVQARTSTLTLLHEVSTVANRARTIDEVLRSVLACICRTGPWILGHAWVLSENGRHLIASGLWESKPEPGARRALAELRRRAGAGRRIERGQGLAGRVVETGEVELIDDQAAVAIDLGGVPGDLGIRRALAFPAVADDRMVAVLELLSQQPLAPADVPTDMFIRIGTQVGDAMQRALLTQAIDNSAIEQQRGLAYELHDTVGQALSGLAMMTESLRQKLELSSHPEAASARTMAGHIEQTHKHVHALSHGFLPISLGVDDLEKALADLAKQVSVSFGVKATLSGNGPVTVVRSEVATHLYRIAQEAVHNALKHGKPKKIMLRLTQEDGDLVLSVRDDGVGFGQEARRDAKGGGRIIMQYRAALIGGRLTIASSPGEGVTVTCRIPGRQSDDDRETGEGGL